jgi:hypothetical protein
MVETCRGQRTAIGLTIARHRDEARVRATRLGAQAGHCLGRRQPVELLGGEDDTVVRALQQPARGGKRVRLVGCQPLGAQEGDE